MRFSSRFAPIVLALVALTAACAIDSDDEFVAEQESVAPVPPPQFPRHRNPPPPVDHPRNDGPIIPAPLEPCLTCHGPGGSYPRPLPVECTKCHMPGVLPRPKPIGPISL